jgi:transposase
MARRSRTDPKSEALRARGSLNPDPRRVADEAFRGDGFFDARDFVQVKYEMVRRAEIDGWPASHAAQTFGVSRPTFYAAKAALDSGGIPALVPAKPGPRRAHKLSEAVVDGLEHALAEDPALGAKDLAELAEERFGVRVHPRSVERALARRREKKRR